MKKIFLFASLVIITSIFFGCSKRKTAQELMKEEKKAIERFIAKNEIEVTNDKEKMYNDTTGKVYYKTPEGLYIHVIDSGYGDNAVVNTEVTVRYKDLISFKTDTVKYSNMSAISPIVFYHKNSSTFNNNGWACSGLDIGLTYVKQNGEVSLIIPSSLQPYSNQSYYEPAYFGYVIYRFDVFN